MGWYQLFGHHTRTHSPSSSEVHQARCRTSNRSGITDLALKRIIMHNEKDGMPITALREIKILKALDHPNVVKVLDIVVMPRTVFS